MKLKKRLHFYSDRHIASNVGKIKQGDTIVLSTNLSKYYYADFFKVKGVDKSKLNIDYIRNKILLKVLPLKV